MTPFHYFAGQTLHKGIVLSTTNASKEREVLQGLLHRSMSQPIDRKNRTISIGCCTPVPINEIIFLLTQNFHDAAINSEWNVDEYILKDLLKKFFDLIVLHQKIDDAEIFSTECGIEKLFLAVPHNHKFAVELPPA